MPADKDQDIKERYKEIKARNERLKAQTYAQYFKMTPTNQTRLMSSFEVKEGKMQMAFMKPTAQQPIIVVDFKKIDFEVLAKDNHPIDQIELHKQIGEMIYSTVTGKTITAHQLQNSLNNILKTELNWLNEKVESLETDYKLAQIQQREETQKSLRMGEKIKVLEKDLTL